MKFWINAAACLVVLVNMAVSGAGADEAAPSTTAHIIGPAGTVRIVGGYPYEKKGHSATPLSDGRVFVYGTDTVGLGGDVKEQTERLRKRPSNISGPYVAEPLLWDPLRRGWKKLTLPPECQYYSSLHTATALPNDMIVIAGGLCDAPKASNDPSPHVPHKGMSVWNGKTEQWETASPALATARIFHTATVLPDGGVLIVGGETDPGGSKVGEVGEAVLDSVELFIDGKVEQATPLASARARHTATALADGSVVVAGGIDRTGKAIASVERFDPASKAWRTLPSMNTPRHSHTAILLGDGRLMVAGGANQDGEPIASVEIWDPASNAWSVQTPLPLPVMEHSAVLLANGDVLVMGGITGKAEAMTSALLWAHAGERWLPAGNYEDSTWAKKESHRLGLVPHKDGSAHVFGFKSILQWAPLQRDAVAYPPYGNRSAYTTTALSDGRVLIAGGRSGNVFHDWVEVFDPATGRYSVTGRLNQARSNHAALRLDDGRVLVAGGWVRAPDSVTRPVGNSPEVWDPVSGRWDLLRDIRFDWTDWVSFAKLRDGRVLFLASRELAEGIPQSPVEYRAWIWDPRTGSVQPKTVPLKPRAGAGIAILPDGRVLAIGGKIRSLAAGHRCPAAQAGKHEPQDDGPCRDEPAQWDEQEYPGAEIWDSGDGSVRALAAPPNWYTQNPRTLVRRDGSVLLTNLQPIDPRNADRKAATVYSWNGASGTWSQLPALSEHQSWPIAELQNGTLATARHRLPPGAGSWVDVHSAPQEEAQFLQLPSGQLLSLAAESPHAATWDESAQRWRLISTGDLAPRWRQTPAALALADGRLMVIGEVEAGPEAVSSAYVWDPKDGMWRPAGNLARRYNGDQATQLGSGSVLFVGIYTGQLVCEIWRPDTGEWRFCGTFTPSGDEKQHLPHFVISQLEDGRGALMAGADRIFVFDEGAGKWTPMAFEWGAAVPAFGAPVRLERPLARAFDESSRSWLDASVIASKYWESGTFDGSKPRFLWDPRKREWAYVFASSRDGMGKGAAFLPDGCALSGPPFRLFNPTTGHVTVLEDPGGVDAANASSAVLADGTVVVVGMSELAGTGFFHRRASCAGFAADTEIWAPVPPMLYRDEIRPPSAVQAASTVPKEPRFIDWLTQYRWIALAVFVPFVAYFLLRFVIIPRFQRLMNFANATALGRIQVPMPSIPPGLRRIVFYGIAALIVLPMLSNVLLLRRAQESDQCAEKGSNCVDKTTGILKSVSIPGGEKDETPAIPCRFVGIWSSIQPGRMYRFTMTSDGRYSGGSSTHGTEAQDAYTGYWAVQGKHMVWRSDGPGEPDVNPIVDEAEGRFTLIESNGSRTRFELIERLPAGHCAQ
jgi:hypothetical protein